MTGLAGPLRDAVVDPLAAWPSLDGQAQGRLLDVAGTLLRRVRWEGTRGFAVDDRMRGLIAGHAALLVVGLADPPFPAVRTVVVSPTTTVLRGPRPSHIPGVVEAGPQPVLGHTSARGPVFVAWDAAAHDARNPARGRNVVLHEFAHRLDVEDGWFDGTPPMRSAALRQRWIEVCEAVFADLRAGRAGPVLRGYAGTNPAEFFAVSTEAFFTRPTDLAVEHPDLYAVLSAFYRQDPAAWTT